MFGTSFPEYDISIPDFGVLGQQEFENFYHRRQIMAAIGISEMLCEVIRSESEYKQLYNTLYKYVSGGSRFSQGPALITGLSDGARNVLCASLAA